MHISYFISRFNSVGYRFNRLQPASNKNNVLVLGVCFYHQWIVLQQIVFYRPWSSAYI